MQFKDGYSVTLFSGRFFIFIFKFVATCKSSPLVHIGTQIYRKHDVKLKPLESKKACLSVLGGVGVELIGNVSLYMVDEINRECLLEHWKLHLPHNLLLFLWWWKIDYVGCDVDYYFRFSALVEFCLLPWKIRTRISS